MSNNYIYIELLYNERFRRDCNLHYLNRLIKILKFYATSVKIFTGEFEKHHILPKNKLWYPSHKSDSNNIIKLPKRVHFLVHHLMWKSFPKCPAMYTAFWNMTHFHTHKLNSKQYAKIRDLHSKNMKENNPAKKPGVMDIIRGDANPSKRPEVREKIGKAHRGKKLSEEQKKKIGDDHRGKQTGDANPAKRPEVREKISKANTGRKSSEESIKKAVESRKNNPNNYKPCPNCNKIIDTSNFSRWHGEKCKSKI